MEEEHAYSPEMERKNVCVLQTALWSILLYLDQTYLVYRTHESSATGDI